MTTTTTARHGFVRLPTVRADDGRVGLRRRTWRVASWVALGVLLGGLLGAAAATRVAVRPLSKVSILINPLPGNALSWASTNTLEDLETESHLARSDVVLARVMPDAGEADIRAARARLDAHVVANTQVIVLTYRGRDQSEATSFTRRIAQAVIEERRERARAVYADRTAILESLIQDAEDDFVRKSSSSGDTALVSVLSRRLAALRGDLREVRASVPDAGFILAASAVTGHSGRRLQYVIASFGGVLGACTGFVIGRRGRRWPGRRSAVGREIA